MTPRALSRQQAAEYVGVSPTTFDGLVSVGEMPRARRYRNCKRVVWLTNELDEALNDLPTDLPQAASPYEGVSL